MTYRTMTSNTDLVSGQMGNILASCRIGDAASIAYVRYTNKTGGSLAGLRYWLRALDSAGVTCQIAIADGTARAENYDYGTPSAPGTWVTPTTYAAGLALPTLTANQCVLLAVRRDPTTGSAVAVESNVLTVSAS